MQPELTNRLLGFSVNTIKLLRKIANTEEYKIIKYQLIKSATSSGANYEEAQGGSSRADFRNKVFISLKEMRESNYRMKVLKGINENPKLSDEIVELINKSQELKNILGSIASKLR